MTGSALVAKSSCLVVPGEDPSPTSASFNFGSLGEHLVVGFLGGIFSCRENNVRHRVAERMLIYKTMTVEMIKLTHTSSSY
jgi:hypothetical protein